MNNLNKVEKQMENEYPVKVLEIFEDVLKVEKNKDYLNLNHNSTKLKINLNLSVKDRYAVSDLIAREYPFNGIDQQPGNLLRFNEHESPESILEKLTTDGFYVLDNKLDSQICNQIKESLKATPYAIRGSNREIAGITEQNISKYKSNAIWAVNQNDILRIPEIQKIAFDDRILNAIGKFFGSDPILCQTNSWWSKNHSNHRSNLSGNAQMYHQDAEYLKFIKVFIYLNDVGAKNGPHKYVKGSALTAEDRLGKDYYLSSRVDDSKVLELFGEENIISFEGKKGTVIIENTLGLHKGVPVVAGARLLLQLEYTNSLYLDSTQFFDPKLLLPSIKELESAHPRMFLNFVPNAELLNKEILNSQKKQSLKQRLITQIRKYI